MSRIKGLISGFDIGNTLFKSEEANTLRTTLSQVFTEEHLNLNLKRKNFITIDSSYVREVYCSENWEFCDLYLKCFNPL